MDYREARALLDQLPRLEVKPGLSRTERLLDGLGHPERAFPAVHIAGTNGKGSVVAMLDAVLRRAGYCVGRFTSPELIDFRDRIAVDGKWVPEVEWAAGITRMRSLLVDASDPPTQFEAIAALAFDLFSRKAVDIALVEVGLGGRFDATNLVRPLMSVLCNVSLDHCAILGESIEEIAWEKAGIAKAGVPLLLGDLLSEAEEVVLAVCDEVGAIPIRADRMEVERIGADWKGARYCITQDGFPETVELGLLGGYQRDNLAIVLGAIGCLRQGGVAIPDEAVVDGLREARWPGRFEVVRRAPYVVLEGAHNVAAAKRLVEDIETFVPQREHRHVLLGMLGDKDVEGIGRTLATTVDWVTFCSSGSPRSLPAAQLNERVGGLFLESTCYDSVAGALDRQMPLLSGNDVLIIAGSLSVVGEARRWFEEGC